MKDQTRQTGDLPSFAELYTPKLVTVLREGYGLTQLRADAIAGLTVAIVALPLSMAIAIASGATPAQGLYTAIVGGFFVSLLGGSRFQIGGPAGAFIVLVAATVAQHGMEGLILATFLSGLMLAAVGFLRLGTFIKFIPFPVTVGFTAGIAVIIFASQIKELLGLTLEHEPGELLEKLPALWEARSSLTPAALLVSAATVAIILGLRRWRPHWPGMLIAVGVAALATALLHLPVATIGTKFGGIPSTLPAPSLPDLSVEKIMAVLPAAISFTLLGAIESLLSAVVADGMTGRRHRSNCELVAQGAANIGSALFGGFCVTGTIARTATNVRSGAHGPVAGMLHALFILLFMAVAAPLAAYIPLAALAGVLAVVACNMIEKPAIAILVRSGWGEATVLAATFFLTIFRDLTEAIVVGFALGSVLFIQRMSKTTAIATHTPFVGRDEADSAHPRGSYDEEVAANPEVVVYRITGALFFGATASIGSVLDRIQDSHKALIVDFSAVPFLDSTGANMIEGLAHKAHKRGVALWLTGASRDIKRVFVTHGLKRPLVHYATTIEDAMAKLRKRPWTISP
ncbi:MULTISPECIES: SulP family inorganic anion transporter [Brucella/Ochrobactrum group]|uniref:SulP family inorganic anion transporter n=1 Tax=Brucella pseudintermedia TaxID=370111 RepID=A0ABY5UGN5_9HYPH|nr:MULTISPECIES: SulP family inorganic anion transporter [Brucella/Ochrobactrum group]KAB2678917.1 SulP family inorganic anion transporter [Brucella pseudintermedia]MCO7727211.1 SulP family inorganic anion transporter [Brucella intermedia]NKE75024.1 SulP family inorganic anion transporter [Ochrobactrum sp. MC-1LL]UWL62514.1 SulP family inorganic anion transporter [Brucella pseudintermedia]WGG59309.1 SulP family inorganic anion transporter [Brucella intermedia]